MTEQELLAQLRDVHLPGTVGWWPPAIGWWLVGCLLIVAVFGVLAWLKRWRANAWRRAALREHERLMTNTKNRAVVRELSVLMRRVAMKIEPRHAVASATDQDWLGVLDRIGQTRDYSEGVGRLLTVWPYRDLALDPTPADELRGLFQLTRRTIQRASLASDKPGGGRV